MKHLLLNCDQVFDVLTRGPFPTGAPDDEGVEHHLRACHECRQLAEALRPAVSLLHEAVTGDEAHDLPEYQGSLPVALPRRPRALPVQSGSAMRSTERAAKSISVLRLLAASVLAAALALLVYGATMSPRNDGPPFTVRDGLKLLPRASADLADGTPDQGGLIRLASFHLPAPCFPEQHRGLLAHDPAALAASLASGSLDALHCCTECHRAGLAQVASTQVASTQVAAVLKESCHACHRG